jgi:hypothetical protein
MDSASELGQAEKEALEAEAERRLLERIEEIKDIESDLG